MDRAQLQQMRKHWAAQVDELEERIKRHNRRLLGTRKPPAHWINDRDYLRGQIAWADAMLRGERPDA